ncbi:MAG: hypothetical protein M1814_000536 [Vezdaea aestivalis]|nr:MAG: hypothetical protein M1814_000536 [Vezdaea aestivalis]
MGSPDTQPKMILYWLEKSRSQRIVWLLEELSLHYEIKTFKRVSGQAPAELKEIHPLGKSPILSIQPPGVDKPIILAESAVIIEYLLKHYGAWMIPKEYPGGQQGLGKETEAWMRYRFFMHYAEGSLMPLMVVALIVGYIDQGPWFLKPITGAITGKINSLYLNPNFATHLKFLEDQLETAPDGGPYFCGKEITGADIILSFPLEAGKARIGLTQEKYPKLWAFAEKVKEREAWQKAKQKIEEDFGEYVVAG